MSGYMNYFTKGDEQIVGIISNLSDSELAYNLSVVDELLEEEEVTSLVLLDEVLATREYIHEEICKRFVENTQRAERGMPDKVFVNGVQVW